MTAGGEPIAEDDIVQRTRLISLSAHKPAERQDVINELAVWRKRRAIHSERGQLALALLMWAIGRSRDGVRMLAATLLPEPVQKRSLRHILQVESSNLLCSG